jgi:hypothetical protein
MNSPGAGFQLKISSCGFAISVVEILFGDGGGAACMHLKVQEIMKLITVNNEFT